MNTIKTAVILAGGRGTRLSEQTHKIPKPLVELHNKPIILHIMEKLAKDGIEKFYILGGYKIEEIYKYFLSNINISNNKLIFSNALSGLEMTNKLAFLKDIEVQIVDTGLNSGTAQRLYQLKDELKEPFLMTYGDGISNVDTAAIEKLLLENDDTIISLCAVPKKERFGLLTIENDSEVTAFKEKSNDTKEFVNGGYICMKPEIFNYFSEEEFDFSHDVLEKQSLIGHIRAHIHNGFWKAIDSQRDLEEAEDLLKEN